jgi:hypothetical protein
MKRAMTTVATLAASPLLIAATPQDYAMILPIETTGEAAAYQIELTQDVYRWSQDANLRDLEIFNADGHAVGVEEWLSSPQTELREQRAEVALLMLPSDRKSDTSNDLRLLVDRDAEGRLLWIGTRERSAASEPSESRDALIDLGAFKHGIDAVELRWSEPSAGIIARFKVEASDDLQSWRSVRDSAAIVLLEQAGARIDQRELSLPRTRARYLRLHRLDAGPALANLSAHARRSESYTSPEPDLRWTDAVVTADAAGQGRRYDVQLPAALPTEAMRIDLGSDNALAQMSLSIPLPRPADNGPRWQPYKQFVAFRLRQADALIDNGEIALSKIQRQQRFLLDSQTPLATPPRLSFGYRPARLVFLAEGAGPYRLAVGSLNARRSDAPVGLALASLRSQFGAQWQPPSADLGTAREAAGAEALKPAPVPTDWRRLLLWGVLIGGAGVVAAIALSLLRGKR